MKDLLKLGFDMTLKRAGPATAKPTKPAAADAKAQAAVAGNSKTDSKSASASSSSSSSSSSSASSSAAPAAAAVDGSREAATMKGLSNQVGAAHSLGSKSDEKKTAKPDATPAPAGAAAAAAAAPSSTK